jgi:hypothetical protein
MAIEKQEGVFIPCDPGSVSDGYHTFDELYDHRTVLFIALCRSYPHIAWRSRKHNDGSAFPGWFIAGMTLHTGAITYHLPERVWAALEGIVTYPIAPRWDGHTPAQVVDRLAHWALSIKIQEADDE